MKFPPGGARTLPCLILSIAMRPPPLPSSTAARSEKLSCLLVLTIDDSVDDRWQHTLAEERPQIPKASKVVKGQYFAAHAFFTHYGFDQGRKAHLRYDLRIAKPDGSTYHEEKDLEGHDGPAGDGKSVLLAQRTLHVSFDPPDPPGEYTVTLVAHDRNGNSEASDTQKIRLVEEIDGKPFASGEELEKWFSSYFESQEPERAIAALASMKLAEPENGEQADAEDERVTASQSFFHEVFEANPWLYPKLVSDYPGFDATTRKSALQLLSVAKYDVKDFAAGLDGDDSRGWKKLAARPRRDSLVDPITDPSHLDVLWGMFLATGKFAPIYRLCEALAPEKTGAVPDRKYSEHKGDPETALRPLIHELAEWSIGSNAEQHPLVKSYCEWILAQKKTPEALRVALKKALES